MTCSHMSYFFISKQLLWELFFRISNSKPGKNIISIAGCTAAQTSLSNYLKGKTAKVTFFAFYSLTENPFSFDQGFCIAFNSSGIMQDNLFVLVGISRDGNKIETKQMNIK